MLTDRHIRRTDDLKHTGGPPETAGFSLVEMLVVVALITILVGVVVPVTIQSRNGARSVACLSNLRQLGSALLAYGQDCDDRLPTLSSDSFAGSFPSDQWIDGSSATQLRSAIAKYVKNVGIYKCGNDSGAPEYGFFSSRGSVFSRAGSSYLPWSAGRTGLYGTAVNGARTSALTLPSGCCILRDYGSDWHGYRRRTGLDVEATTVANAAYADGHAAAVPILSITLSDRRYVCYASNRANAVFISGGSSDIKAILSGRRMIDTDSSGQQRLQLCLSGTVDGGGISYNVDRVFSFGVETKIDATFRQVVIWVDGLADR